MRYLVCFVRIFVSIYLHIRSPILPSPNQDHHHYHHPPSSPTPLPLPPSLVTGFHSWSQEASDKPFPTFSLCVSLPPPHDYLSILLPFFLALCLFSAARCLCFCWLSRSVLSPIAISTSFPSFPLAASFSAWCRRKTPGERKRTRGGIRRFFNFFSSLIFAAELVWRSETTGDWSRRCKA